MHRDKKYCIGSLSKKTRRIRVVNVLTKQEKLLEVCAHVRACVHACYRSDKKKCKRGELKDALQRSIGGEYRDLVCVRKIITTSHPFPPHFPLSCTIGVF